MATLPPAQIYALARNAGLSAAAATVATAVALGESGGRTDAQGDVGIQTSKWGPSVGLWQIRSLKADYGTGRTRDAAALTDPNFNARSMVAISSGGKSWTPWTVYTSGAYRQHLTAAGGAAIGGSSDSGSASTSGGGLSPFGSPSLGFDTALGHEPTTDLGELVDQAGDLNPLNLLDGWHATAVKLVFAAGAVALVVVGATQTVK